MKNKISFSQAFWILFGSLGTVFTLALLTLGYIRHVKHKHYQDPQFNIVAIAQASGNPQELKTVYLAELLDLSADRPQNLYRFNVEEARQKLMGSSLIKEVEIKKLKPGTLFLHYQMRHPIAFLADFSNTALDEEGFLIPFKPFFTPKNLPQIYLGEGEDDIKWGRSLKGQKGHLALKVFKLIQAHCCSENVSLQRLDVSKAYTLSYGQRQIIAILEEKVPTQAALVISPRILRLSSKNYAQELANYLALRKILNERVENPKGEKGMVKGSPFIVDLRAPHMAYVTGW